MLTRDEPAVLQDAGPKFPRFGEFVALIALMMGVTAYSIDNLLPAFDYIREEFRVENPNDLQLLVYGYMIAFGIAQLAYGPLADMFGRRPVLLGGTLIFALGSALAIFAPSFSVLMAARIIQGIGTAAARVLAVAVVRDRYSGREMARVMSLAMMVFLIVPILAPAIGAGLVALGSWRLVFWSMLALALILALWFGLRMPETLHPQYRLPFSAARIGAAARLTLTTRVALGYSLGVGLLMGCMLAYVGSAQQILETSVYNLGPSFTIYFALVAGTMAFASLGNSLLVRRFGMRRLSHTGMCGFVLIAALQLVTALAYSGQPPLALFILMISLNLFLFALTVPNFNAMAMEPLGAVAGTAASLIGASTTLIGALCGAVIGRAFDGTVIPLAVGFLTLSTVCLATVLWTERGMLFRTSSTPESRSRRF
jgi:DHA1 family bicyclomycin/chloramphenicol resistance-like MFS transporter